MKGSALLPVIFAALVPLLLFGLIITAISTGNEWVAWRPPLLWTDHFGATQSHEGSGVTAMTVSKSGSFVGGYVNWTAYGPGSAFLSNYDSSGRVVWTRTVSDNLSSAFPQGYPTDRPISGIATWSNEVYVSANVNATSVVSGFDTSGNRNWNAKMGGLYSEIDGVAVNPTGVYGVGWQSFANLLQKYDTSGRLVWNTTFPQSFDFPIGLAASSSGEFVLTDQSLINFDLNGNMVWTRPVSCLKCVDGQSLSETGEDLYVANDFGLSKYATDGSVAWNANFTYPRQFDVTERVSVSVNSSGAYLLIEPSDTANLFLVRYDPSGKEVWRYALPVDNEDSGRSTPYLAAGNGNLYVGGVTFDTNYGLVEEYNEGASLVFFGVNPPWSFVILGGLGGAILFTSIFSIRRSIRKNNTRHRTKRVTGIPSD